VAKTNEAAKTKTFEIDMSNKTGADKYKVLDAKVSVKKSVHFDGVGEAYMLTSKATFENYFNNSDAAIDFTNNRILAIIGQPTEYPTTLSVKSTYASDEGYVIRIQENQEPNKGSVTMMPYILLQVPNTDANKKFIVYIDQKKIELK
jgi:hypothetical protein